MAAPKVEVPDKLPSRDRPLTPFRRKRPPGRSGGRRVGRVFFFVPSQGQDSYPDEWERPLDGIYTPDNMQSSWAWALAELEIKRNLWMVIPLRGKDGSPERVDDVNSVRASIWSTLRRRGLEATSLVHVDALWVKAI